MADSKGQPGAISAPQQKGLPADSLSAGVRESSERLARRYGVAARSIGARYDEIRNVLALEPGDPRYLGEVN